MARDGSRRYLERKVDVVVLSDGKKRGPNLPPFTPFVDDAGEKIRWHPQTRKWWNSWRTSPQSMQMQTDQDWQFLLDTAALHHKVWNDGRIDLLGEIRLRVGKLGATPEDRERLHMKVANAPTTEPGAAGWAGELQPSSMDEFRERHGALMAMDDERNARILADEEPTRTSLQARISRLTKDEDH